MEQGDALLARGGAGSEVHVLDDEVVGLRGDGGDGRLGGGGDARGEAAQLEEEADGLGHRSLILDDEDALGGHDPPHTTWLT